MNIISVLLMFLLSCSKNDTPPVTPPPDVGDTTVVDPTPAQYGIPFENVPDRENAIIYQVNIRAFSSTGDFKGVIARLDSIKALGINVIYLMPIYPVGITKSVNSPYCVKDYVSVNSEFGTLAELRALVDGAHARNMVVMLDWVANHTSWDNVWVTEHKDWYQQDAGGNIISPPNTTYTDVAQLNFNNAAMRLQMIKDMKYWVYAANIDGFRCDFADHPPVDFWQQAIDTLRNIKTHKLLLLAEGSRSANFTAGFDYNFGFGFYDNLKSIYNTNKAVTSVSDINAAEYTSATGTQRMVRYITNHDVNGSDGTPFTVFHGEDGSMAAFVVAALLKSVPMIYNGQEVGFATSITFPFTSVHIDWTPNAQVTNAYKQIINFINSNNVARNGDVTLYNSADVCVFTRTYNNKKILVIVNMRNAVVNYTSPNSISNTAWKDAFDGSAFTVSATMQLQPYNYKILVSE